MCSTVCSARNCARYEGRTKRVVTSLNHVQHAVCSARNCHDCALFRGVLLTQQNVVCTPGGTSQVEGLLVIEVANVSPRLELSARKHGLGHQ